MPQRVTGVCRHTPPGITGVCFHTPQGVRDVFSHMPQGVTGACRHMPPGDKYVSCRIPILYHQVLRVCAAKGHLVE